MVCRARRCGEHSARGDRPEAVDLGRGPAQGRDPGGEAPGVRDTRRRELRVAARPPTAGERRCARCGRAGPARAWWPSPAGRGGRARRVTRARRRCHRRPRRPGSSRSGSARRTHGGTDGPPPARAAASIAALASRRRGVPLARHPGVADPVRRAGVRRASAASRRMSVVLDLPAAGHLLDHELGVHPRPRRVRPGRARRRPAGRRSGRGTRRRCWSRPRSPRPRSASTSPVSASRTSAP